MKKEKSGESVAPSLKEETVVELKLPHKNVVAEHSQGKPLKEWEEEEEKEMKKKEKKQNKEKKNGQIRKRIRQRWWWNSEWSFEETYRRD